MDPFFAPRENTSECRNFEVILKKMMRWCCAVLRCALRCAVLHCAVLQAMLGGLINQGGRTFNSTVGKRRLSDLKSAMQNQHFV
jgi:hypothetical protein